MNNFQFSIFPPKADPPPAGNFQKDRGATTNRGFTLLIAIIFMSVMLSFGLALGSLGYKQQVLASSAIESQYAFYAADSLLECALYHDQQLGTFAFNSDLNAPTPTINCSTGALYPPPPAPPHTSSLWVMTYRVEFDNATHCADATVYKYSTVQPSGFSTYIFSQGYDVSCATVANSATNGARLVSRGLDARY